MRSEKNLTPQTIPRRMERVDVSLQRYVGMLTTAERQSSTKMPCMLASRSRRVIIDYATTAFSPLMGSSPLGKGSNIDPAIADGNGGSADANVSDSSCRSP